MKTPLSVLARVATVGALALLSQEAKSQILYQNYNPNLTENFAYTGEAGNEVILQGGAPTDLVTGFNVQFFLAGTGAATGNLVLNFYDNDGANVDGYPSPGTLIYSTAPLALTSFTTGSQAIFNAADFGGGVVVPKDFTWTVEFTGLTNGETAGLALYGPTATVGANYGDAWYNDSWELQTLVNGGALEFGAEIDGSSVPDSSSLPISVSIVLVGFALMKRFQPQT